MGSIRKNKPSGEALSARVNHTAIPSGPLSYATKGQLTMRPQMHGGKAGIKMGTGIYPKANAKRSSRSAD
jgi:hypothetical protein